MSTTLRPSAVSEPAFCVGQVRVFGDLILAPMSGFSDMPYRVLCRRFGSAMSYTQFVSAQAVLHRLNDYTRRALAFLPEERPVVFQLCDNDEERLTVAALRVAELGPDIIDVNMGCSVHRISARGAGAGLLKEPDRVARIFRRLSRAVPFPVTGKIRLGWDPANQNYLEIVRAMQDNGAALVAVHARTRDQGYSGMADWYAIARVVEIARVPVIGNGDIRNVSDVDRMKRETGCAAVMVGRGAIGHPWIFQRRERGEISLAEKLQTIRSHLDLMQDFYGRPRGLILLRKHLTRYFNDWRGIRDLRPQLVRAETPEQLMALLNSFQERQIDVLRHRS